MQNTFRDAALFSGIPSIAAPVWAAINGRAAVKPNTWEWAATEPSAICLYMLIDDGSPPKSRAKTPAHFLRDMAGMPTSVRSQITAIEPADVLAEQIWQGLKSATLGIKS
ncbi:hypothetical protein B0H14DRAFT_2595083 [Mycena olivaceomarginata]|nr:hypothetical protein B0H14DRAFT_2595083 [Mycena olivaceomarginata]